MPLGGRTKAKTMLGTTVPPKTGQRRRLRRPFIPGGGAQIIAPSGVLFPSVSIVDTIGPNVTVVSQSVAKISRVAGKDTVAIAFNADEDWQQYDLRVVSSITDDATMGTRVRLGPNDQSFETAGSPGGSGWTTGSSPANRLPALSFSSTWASDGARSLRMQSNGIIAFAGGNFQQAFTPKFPISPGNIVSTIVDFNMLVGTGPMIQTGIVFWNAAGAFLSQQVASFAAVRDSGAPVLDNRNNNAVAPATAASFSISIVMNGDPASGALEASNADLYADNMRIVWPAGQNHVATFAESEFEAAAAIEGSNLLKIFAQDMIGNWST